MQVKLRERNKGKKISLYLDYYNNGKRYYEFLKLYLFPEIDGKKLSPFERNENRQNRQLAEAIRAKRQVEIQNGNFGFLDKEIYKIRFIDFLNKLANDRGESAGNYGNWKSTINHVSNFCGEDILLHQIDSAWLEDWKYYLKTFKSGQGKKLAANTQVSYYSKIIASLKRAVKEKLIPENPSLLVNSVKGEETHRNFLTLEELKLVSSFDCRNPELKKAFLFSCLTGLRWSDIVLLRWKDLQFGEELGYFIRFTQKKTKSSETLPISEDARELLGDSLGEDEPIFIGLKYSAWNNLMLREWVKAAGVNKDITFHCARHTNATLLLTNNVDLYTVSKLLGHKNIKTTQVYAEVVNERKRDAVNTIKYK